MSSLHAGVIAVLLLAPGAAASAQVLQPPPRTTGGLFGGDRPVDPNRSRQELTLTLNVLGGYDDVLVPEGQSTPAPDQPRHGGYSGLAGAAGRYWLGRATRHIEATGRTHVSSYSNLVRGSLFGGEGDMSATTELGRRVSVDGALRAGYVPTFMIDAITPVPGQQEGAAGLLDPSAGATELKSVTSGATAGIHRDWTRRQRTTATYDFARHEFVGGPADTSSRTHTGSIGHHWQFSRNTGLRGGYNYSTGRSEERSGDRQQLQMHSVDVGIDVRKRLSPTRQFGFSFGGGATRARTPGIGGTEFTYVAPSAYGSVTLDFARTWNAGVDVQRTVTPVEGFGRQSFITNAVALSLGGRLRQRVTVAFSGSLSRGRAPAGQPGSFESSIGALQVDYLLGRWGSLFTSYSYYDHALRGITGVPDGLPTNFDRNSFRIGMTVWVPLYGSFSGERGQAPARN